MFNKIVVDFVFWYVILVDNKDYVCIQIFIQIDKELSCMVNFKNICILDVKVCIKLIEVFGEDIIFDLLGESVVVKFI